MGETRLWLVYLNWRSYLLAEPTERWKIVYLHRPIWSQGLHGSDELGVNEALVELFDRHHVALVLSGHDHNYERFVQPEVHQQTGNVLLMNKGQLTW